MRNPHLSRGMLRILKLMSHSATRGAPEQAGSAEANFDAELITDGQKWYVGAESVDAAAGQELVALDLVRQCSANDPYRGYRITEEGQRVLEQPGYVPLAASS